MEANNSGFLPPGDDDELDDIEAGDSLCIDLDTFNQILEEIPQQSNQAELAHRNMPQGDVAPESIQLQSEFQLDEWTSTFQELLGCSPQASDSRVGASNGSFDHHWKSETSTQKCAPFQASSASLKEWVLAGQGTSYTERAEKSLLEIPSCSTAATFAEVDIIHAKDHGDNLNFDLVDNRTGTQLNNTAEEFNYEDALYSPSAENMDFIFDYVGDIQTNTLENLEAPENKVARYNFPSFGGDMSSHNATSAESTICHGSDVISDFSDPHSDVPHCLNGDDAYFADSSTRYLPISTNHMLEEAKGSEVVEFSTESACSSSRIVFNAQGWTNNRTASQQQYSEGEVNEHYSLVSGNFPHKFNDGILYGKELLQPFSHSQSFISSNEEMGFVMNDGKIFRHAVEALDKSVQIKSTNNCHGSLSIDEYSKHSFSDISPSISNQGFTANGKDAPYYQGINLNVSSHSSLGGEHMNLTSSELYFSSSRPIISTKMQLGCFGNERENILIPPRGIGRSKVSPESIHSTTSDCRSHVDDDPDIYILEDISQPACSNQSSVLVTKTPTVLNTAVSNPLHNSGMEGIRLKGKDEQLVFRVALQGLSQPTSEASPPDGVLTVPLLQHQRIALSWMTQKEKAGPHCLGGILADDQGLGKTVSTIALILKERPPSSRESSQDMRKIELETLNLDDEDDDDEGMKLVSDDNEVMLNCALKKSSSPSGQAKGRPAGGTLIVCPTSVMRQWAGELHNKVTSKANLSVLMYHGSNRTKDPFELAKYDVVVTTYSIVSMEVPRQPPVQEDDDEKGKFEGETASMDFQQSRKRKYPPSSSKKGVKHKKGVDEMLLDSASRPLAKVGWFRIVLDEAQSIKNHRTQVARACWGLRAKRRWCLSGTPIQNAIDDLYSYFRFLRYDPYAAYKSFCSSIKFPITKNPAKGYSKLQAILQTIMLRRTKGTLLDGKPIINLPPKVIELKKVEFTKEEREFYSRLETDSRAQFKEYADAGTVKQNYVNILLMLLRLRQACDHPLLVRGFDSNSLWRSSFEIAKKLPREKLTFLLSCLSSLALCGICNDPPEDAVVAVCGHVFCNQCISEHLSGDDNQCPNSGCKVRLNASSVFSNTALNNTLSEQSGHDSSLDCSGSQVVEVTGPHSENSVNDSSKIKAALEVLQSLSKTQDHRTKSSAYLEGSLDLNSRDSSSGSPDEKNLVTSNSSNDSSKVLGEKALVFSQWTRMLDLFEACLKRSSIQYRRLDGTMSVAARDKAVKDFNTLPEVSVIIMSLKAASLGLNMVAACHVLLLDLWWNPTTEDQAIDRAHRIGQTRPVTVLRLTVKDTVEDRILALQQKKREMVASAFGEDKTGCRQSHLTVEDLEYLFRA